MSNIFFSWKINTKKERWAFWYILVFSIAIWLIVWGFLTKQYWMSFVIILIIGIYFYVENNSSDMYDVKITELWISVWDSFYPFSSIKNFSIVYDEDKAIYLRIYLIKKIWIIPININIDNSIVSNIENILKNFLEQKESENITFTEKLINISKI